MRISFFVSTSLLLASLVSTRGALAEPPVAPAAAGSDVPASIELRLRAPGEVTLEVFERGAWRAACVSPCTAHVAPGKRYRVRNEDNNVSDVSAAPEEASEPLVLSARPSTPLQKWGGGLLVGLGATTLAVGALALATSVGALTIDNRGTLAAVGGGLVVGGGLMTFGGAELLRSGKRPSFEQSAAPTLQGGFVPREHGN